MLAHYILTLLLLLLPPKRLPSCNSPLLEETPFVDTTFVSQILCCDESIEMYCKKSDKGNGNLILFLHGSSGNGLKNISQSWFDYWLHKGFAVAAISLPGHGTSSGSKDFCGPQTIKSLHHVIDTIKKELLIDSYACKGFGQGAIAGLLLNGQRNVMNCIVSANGAYDLLRHTSPNDPVRKTLIERNYDINPDDLSSLKVRSPIEYVKTMHAPVYLLHRDGNPVIQVEEVQSFYQAMLENEKICILSILENTPENDSQILSYEEMLRKTERWIEHNTQPFKN